VDNPATSYVGQAVPRREDERLVTGRARWTGNLHPPGTYHLGVVRSPLAHGRITAVDVAPARELPDVVAAFTGRDLASWFVDSPGAVAPDGAYIPQQPPVAVDVTRFVGEPVAVVVARSAAAAQDAVDLVDVDYEPLPAVPTIDDALADGTLLHPDAGTNVAYRYEGHRAGDLDTELAASDVVVRRTYDIPRLMGVALEPRSTLAEPRGDQLVITTSTQSPHRIRAHLATFLGLEEDVLRVIAPDVGGGFGVKLPCYAEDVLCTALARHLDHPVAWVATRSEDLQTTLHGRGMRYDVTIGASADGRLRALHLEVTGDCGAYLSRVAAMIHLNGDRVGPGCYPWEAFWFDATGVFTTAPPTGAYRGAGRPEAAYALERGIDALAYELGLDPIEVRRRNLPAADRFPFRSISGATFTSGDFLGGLERLVAAGDLTSWRAEQRRRIEAGASRLIGIGTATFMDRCGTGPGLSEHGAVRVHADGRVVVRTGLGPTGQGTATSLGQIVADALHVDLRDVEVVHGDTGVVPNGTGTFGSRSMSVGGVAVAVAAHDVLDRARDALAHLLEADVEDVEVADGAVGVRGAPETRRTLAEVAAAIEDGTVDGMTELTATTDFEPDGFTFPSGAYAAIVEVDTDTGQVVPLHLVAVDDVGEIINPQLLQGQIHGGVAQGIAQALYEEVVHDDAGNLITGSLIDYQVPSAADLSPIDATQFATPGPNLLRTKGAGESGTIGAPPAVLNAVVDALRHLGVDDVPMPCTPERVWRAIQAATG
jgi:aerobic carbon-monoxide dehydrogenase large subunit